MENVPGTDEWRPAVTRDARIFGPGLAAMPSYASPAEYARLYGDAGPPASPPRRR